jgi:DNA-3-methyladenine glycosylase II
VAEHGKMSVERRLRERGQVGDPWAVLVSAVVGQQLSAKAAATIRARLTEPYGDRMPTPAELLEADEKDLRAAGLSGRKVEYVRDLARHVAEGELDLDALATMSDEEAISEITAVRGFGRWSAEMFLIFHLGRPDVLPVGDLGIRRAVERVYGLNELPDPDELEQIAEPWRPQRTLACLYLWESLRNAPVA